MDEDKRVKRLISGDKAVINELYADYSSRLYHFAFGYLKSGADSLDIVQEVFVNLWNSRKNLKKNSNLEAYLFTVAKNTIISVFRKRLSEKNYLENLKFEVVDNSIDTESKVNYDLLAEKVQELIEKLPPQRRRIYVMCKEKGYTNQLVASELNISLKTVEDHMTKARKFLKENLSEYGFIALLYVALFLS
ncbi:RNA polymerase sigma-70 factor [Maribellus comscasis]|uniref:RNA polymerase sigma-70 factor n=1 Tax=Maribellus comscasis TaxID=2681766 RepID=A0A6I6JMN1_9BACT|nr:RNA polymerase sigma-70 factor [Maribellus comscasis]QGY43671.1 RNA polymerase sigma-70 factor [Maribellus comscasis]